MDYQLADQSATPPTPSSYWVLPSHLLAGAYPGHQDPAEHQARIHGLVDAVMFFWVWWNPDGFRKILEHNALQSGVSDLFLLWVALAVAGTLATVFSLSMLAKTQRAHARPGL